MTLSTLLAVCAVLYVVALLSCIVVLVRSVRVTKSPHVAHDLPMSRYLLQLPPEWTVHELSCVLGVSRVESLRRLKMAIAYGQCVKVNGTDLTSTRRYRFIGGCKNV